MTSREPNLSSMLSRAETDFLRIEKQALREEEDQNLGGYCLALITSYGLKRSVRKPDLAPDIVSILLANTIKMAVLAIR